MPIFLIAYDMRPPRRCNRGQQLRAADVAHHTRLIAKSSSGADDSSAVHLPFIFAPTQFRDRVEG
jgi:hypothetical protein